MMEGSIQKEIERGEKALKASGLLLEQGLYEDTVSRAYYAVLHLAKAALLSQGVRTSSHKGIITQFGLHIVKKGLVDQELAKILAKGKEDREIGDYDVLIDIKYEQAKQRVDEATQFVTRIKEFLKKSND